jgi:hypothetical protein
VFWVHNDRNNSNRIFAFNTSGKNLGEFYLNNIENRDWEDIAIGPGPTDGIDYLYVGDFGDNFSEYDLKYIYRIEEPFVDFMQDPVNETINNVKTITCQYPDGVRDAEALMLDPLTKDLYIISKRELYDIRLYRIPYPQSTSEVITLENSAILNFTQITGADISPSGLEILIKDYQNIYYWNRTADENIWDVLTDEPIIVPYIVEPQGEAVCWGADEMGYYTVSEEYGIEANLYYYPRINPAQVIINEIMYNPLSVSDTDGEWIELYNNSTEAVDLNGWSIRDDNSDNHVINVSLILNPGSFLLLGNNSNQLYNGGVSIDYQYDNFSMDDINDAIYLLSPLNEVIDDVSYDDGLVFPLYEGCSIALLDPNMENNFGLHWRESVKTYGNVDKGTPGNPNFGEAISLSIYDIQYTEDPSGSSPYEGQHVTVSGVVSVEPQGFSNDLFFIQDSNEMWSGIFIKKFHPSLHIGDSVKATGVVVEYYGNYTEIINISDFEILKEGVFGINPIQVSTGEVSTGGINAEAYEGVLIKVTGTCENDNLGWREWSINDGSGPTIIYSRFSNDFIPEVGETYSVTGIQYFRNNNFMILPWIPYEVITDIDTTNNQRNLPENYELYQNRPNPFNPTTIIKYAIPSNTKYKSMLQKVTLKVYDILGRDVATLVSEEQPPGNYQVVWDAEIETSGIYFYRLEVGSFIQTKKMVLLR